MPEAAPDRDQFRNDDQSASRRRVTAVVTSFRPESPMLDHIALLRAQVDEVVVVDDGSGPVADAVLDAAAELGARVVRMENNGGIAKALNAGIIAAAPRPRDFVVTFDQDSAVPEGFVTSLVETWDQAIVAGIDVGLVCPALFAREDQSRGGGGHADGMFRAREPIQSGAMYSGATLRRIGRFREEFFIDLVDVEHFLRMRAMGMEGIAAAGLHLPHELGRTYPVRVFGRQIVTANGPLRTSMSTPFRYYYRMRNRVVVNRKYPSMYRQYLLEDTAREFIHWGIVLFLAKPRVALARVLARGVRDGWAGRMGPIPDYLVPVARTVTWRVEAEPTSLR